MRSLIVVWAMIGLLVAAQSLITDWHEVGERWLARAVWIAWLLTWVFILGSKP